MILLAENVAAVVVHVRATAVARATRGRLIRALWRPTIRTAHRLTARPHRALPTVIALARQAADAVSARAADRAAQAVLAVVMAAAGK